MKWIIKKTKKKHVVQELGSIHKILRCGCSSTQKWWQINMSLKGQFYQIKWLEKFYGRPGMVVTHFVWASVTQWLFVLDLSNFDIS